MTKLKLGIHKHYKGGEGSIWIRPIEMFTEPIELNGKSIPRFKYLKET